MFCLFLFLGAENLIFLGLKLLHEFLQHFFQKINFLSRLGDGAVPFEVSFPFFSHFFVFVIPFFHFPPIFFFFSVFLEKCVYFSFFSMCMPLLAFVLGFNKRCFLRSRYSQRHKAGSLGLGWATFWGEHDSTPQNGVEAPLSRLDYCCCFGHELPKPQCVCPLVIEGSQKIP